MSRKRVAEPCSLTNIGRRGTQSRILFHNTGGKLMISKTWSRKPIEGCVAVAILSVYSMEVFASPAAKAPSGELEVSGIVNGNGESVVAGGTGVSDSVITTLDLSIAS